VTDLQFDPRNDNLISSSWDGTVKIWSDLPDNVQERSALSSPVVGLSIAKSAEVGLAIHEDGIAEVFEPASGTLIREIRHNLVSQRWVTLSQNGLTAVSWSSGGHLGIWDVEEGKLLACSYTPPLFRLMTASASISSSGRWVALVTDVSELLIVDVSLGMKITRLSTGYKSVTFVDGSDTLCASTRTGCIELWDIVKQQRVATAQLSEHELNLHLCATTEAVASWQSSDKKTFGVLLWDLCTQEVTAQLSGHDARVTRISLIAGGDFVAMSTRREDGADYEVTLFERETGKQAAVLHRSIAEIVGLSVSMDGQHVLAAGTEGYVHAWDIREHNKVCTYRNNAWFSGYAFISGTNTMVLGDHRGYLHTIAFEPR
jgi:WD40 repeat protein